MSESKPKPVKAQEIQTSDLSAMLGISARQVARLGDKGILKRGTRTSHWLMAESVRAYAEYLRGQVGNKGSDFESARAREKDAKARLAEMAADIQEGKLLTVDDVSEANSSILTALVSRFCNFGDGVANVCHNQPAEFIADRVNGGLRSALREVAKLPHVPEDEKKKTLQRLGFES
jgi:hypothetical protein